MPSTKKTPCQVTLDYLSPITQTFVNQDHLECIIWRNDGRARKGLPVGLGSCRCEMGAKWR